VNASAVGARIIDALEDAANRETRGATALVSVNVEMLAPASAGQVVVSVTRKTRTLIFLRADFRAGDATIAIANSVHKVAPPES
jgi:hypothetical protein